MLRIFVYDSNQQKITVRQKLMVIFVFHIQNNLKIEGVSAMKKLNKAFDFLGLRKNMSGGWGT
jgi:hypothetical protein